MTGLPLIIARVETAIIELETKKFSSDECNNNQEILANNIKIRLEKFRASFIANKMTAQKCFVCQREECVTPITDHTITYTTTKGPYDIPDLSGTFCHVCEYFEPSEDSNELLDVIKRKIRFGATPPVEENIVFDSTEKTGFCVSKLESAYELNKKLEILQNQLKASESVNEISLIIDGVPVFIHQDNFLHSEIKEYLQVCIDTKIRELKGLGVVFNA